MRLPNSASMPFVVVLLGMTLCALLLLLVYMRRSCNGTREALRFVPCAYFIASVGMVEGIAGMYDRATATSVIPVLAVLGIGVGIAMRFGVIDKATDPTG